MIERIEHLTQLGKLLGNNPVVAILGARQVGKTTLATQFLKGYEVTGEIFDLERPSDVARLGDPELTLNDLTGLVAVDEIQRMPELFPLLRVLADRQPIQARFLLLGSAAPNLRRQGNETLAGRIAYHPLGGLSLFEFAEPQINQLWLRGGFPRSFLATSEQVSWEWREAFISTFLERDLPQLGIRVGSSTMRRFWTMLAHCHGQIWNASVFARNFGVNHTTIRHYLDILIDALVIYSLRPWHANVNKRQVKAPKIYFSDTGLLHALLGISTFADLESHPIVGLSWESFAMKAVVEQLGVQPHECYFWKTHAGAELDLLVSRGTKRIGFEFKRASMPKATKSMHFASEDLQLEHLYVVHAGSKTTKIAKHITALSLSALARVLDRWNS